MADALLGACRACPGEPPAQWEYPGRERIVFAAERDAHVGSLSAYAVTRLPPAVRAGVAGGDPNARLACIESCAILDAGEPGSGGPAGGRRSR
jgi:hypothetical protein